MFICDMGGWREDSKAALLPIAQWVPHSPASERTHMNKDQVVGKIKDLAGEAQAGIGKAIDSPTQVAKGKALEAEGELQKKAGDLLRVPRTGNPHWDQQLLHNVAKRQVG